MDVKVTNSLLMTALITGSVLWGGTAAFAEESVGEFELDPMVVTAQRMETRDLDTPASVSVITAKDIENSGATTVMEAVRKTAGITDYSYGPGGDDLGSSYSRIFIRGFDKGALVLINGAPININNYASVSGIPVESVERIEIVKGANSVLYGAEALGGVINIITKKGNGKLRTTISTTGGNYLKKYNITTQGEGVIASFGKDYVHEYEDAQLHNLNKGTYRVNEKYERTSAFTSLALSPNLQLTYNYNKMDPMYGPRKISDGSHTDYRYAYVDTKHAASLVYTDDNNQTKTILAYNSKKVEGTRVNAKNEWSLAGDTSNYTNSNINLDTQKKWNINDKDSLIVGASLKHEKYDQIYKNKYDNSRNSYGLYASYNKYLSDKFSTTLGLRGQYYTETDFENSHKTYLPQLQTLYKFDEQNSWYTNIGKAFEVSAVNSHAGRTLYKNLPPVDPEEGWTYETGFKRITDTTSTKIAVFHMNYKNKFAWKHYDWMPGKETIQVNLGKFENTGLELEYQKILSNKWSYNLSATVQNPESFDEDMKAWIQESARLQFSAGVDYSLNKVTASLNSLVLADREISSIRYDTVKYESSKRNSDHDLRNRVMLNASFKYAPTDNQNFVLNLYNLLDRKDPVSTYEYYDLPFNWTLTYNFTF